MTTQYVAVRFRPGDRRTYTYHNDGDPVAVGDEVKVPDRSGDGWQRVTVEEVGNEKPLFTTKPILGLAPAEVPAAASSTAIVPRKVGGGEVVEGFRWRTREGEHIPPAEMETRHLFYTLRLIWNCHVKPEERVGGDRVKLYRFGPSYTRAYFEDAISNLAAETFKRDDLAPWQLAELEEMAGHTANRSGDQLALDSI